MHRYLLNLKLESWTEAMLKRMEREFQYVIRSQKESSLNPLTSDVTSLDSTNKTS